MIPYYIKEINSEGKLWNVEIPETIRLEEEGIRHIVLTGKNGCGKTAFLKEILYATLGLKSFVPPPKIIFNNPPGDIRKDLIIDYFSAYRNLLGFRSQPGITRNSLDQTIKQLGNPVSNVDGNSNLSAFHEFLTSLFIRRNELSSAIQNNEASVPESKEFEIYEKCIYELGRAISEMLDLSDPYVLRSNSREGGFSLRNLSTREELKFEKLPAGYSSVISILIRLYSFIIIRQINALSNEMPPGIIFIDEPENHLHLEFQYTIMPFLIKRFPSFQFIVATHSPAIISSIENAIVYDLSNRDAVKSSRYLSRDFNSIMIEHFGVRSISETGEELLKHLYDLVLRFEKDPTTNTLTPTFSEVQDVKSRIPPYIYTDLLNRIIVTCRLSKLEFPYYDKLNS